MYATTHHHRRIFCRFAAAMLLAAACTISGPTPTLERPAEAAQTATPTPFVPLPADPSTPDPLPGAAPGSPEGPPAGQETGFHSLVVPEGWFFSSVVDMEISAVVFTPIDPDALAAFAVPGWLVPPDFSIAALVQSPLPPGADADALRAGMDGAIAGMTDEDFLSLLAGAERIGLVETAAFNRADLADSSEGELGGRPAISVLGSLLPGEDLHPRLLVRIHLAWTEQAFFTFYTLATETAADAFQEEMAASLASVDLP